MESNTQLSAGSFGGLRALHPGGSPLPLHPPQFFGIYCLPALGRGIKTQFLHSLMSKKKDDLGEGWEQARNGGEVGRKKANLEKGQKSYLQSYGLYLLPYEKTYRIHLIPFIGLP